MRDFEDNAELLTALPVQKPELSWMEQDSGAGMANWALILMCSLLVLFTILGVYICVVMRRNKSHRNLQEAAIIRELELAKSEGIEIPEDLEKRLGKLQMDEEWKDMDGKKGTQKGKVFPGDKGKLTRYASHH